MTVLVDTNVLLRHFEPGHPHHRAAVDSITRLMESGEAVHVTPQNIAEFWAVATRSSAQNGLGLPVAVVAAVLDHIERVFALLPDDSAINNRPRSSKVPIIGYELSSGPAASSALNPGGTWIAPRRTARWCKPSKR